MAAKALSGGDPSQGKVPIYEKIAWQLRKRIVNGDYGARSKLPIESELCQEFGVSRHTVREALRLLRQERLISSNKKAGTIVTPHTNPASTFLHALSVDELLTFSNQWSFTTTASRMAPLDEDIRDWLGVDDAADWLRVEGIAQYELSQNPECWFVNYVHSQCADVQKELQVGQKADPILPLIERCCKVTVVSLEQEVSAISLPRKIAVALRAEDETIAMSVRRICRVIGGDVALITDEIYPASRFKYRFLLNRQAPAD